MKTKALEGELITKQEFEQTKGNPFLEDLARLQRESRPSLTDPELARLQGLPTQRHPAFNLGMNASHYAQPGLSPFDQHYGLGIGSPLDRQSTYNPLGTTLGSALNGFSAGLFGGKWL